MQEDHHFCRWHLPEGHCADAALAAAFPGASKAQAAHQLDTCSPKELREVFATIFGSPTTSNNTSWIRQKLKGALGLGGKKQRGPGAAGRKRPSGGGGGRPAAKQARGASPEPEAAGGAWGAAGHPAGRSPRMGRSPSSDWDCFSYEAWSEEQGVVDSSAAVEGAATLLAAAAEVESREAAAAAAAAATAAAATTGSGGVSCAGGAPAAHGAGARPSPDSPGGSATGSSLAPPPAASQQVQALLNNCLRLAGPAPAPPAAAAGPAQAPAQGPLQASFLSPDQLGKVQQQVAVMCLLAALAGVPSGSPQ